MEASNMCNGLCSKSAVPPIQIAKKSFFVRLPPLPSSYPFDRFHKWVSYRASNSIRALPRKRLECRNTAEQLGVINSDREEVRRKKLAVFVSGGGSNFRSIHEAALRGSVHGDVVVLVASKSGCGGAEYAKNSGIPVILFPKTRDDPDGLSPSDLVDTLRRLEIDFILLAGYLKLIPIELIRAYPRSIINIHPSLLPSFGGKGYYGVKVHKAVIASGVRYSGPTIHFVDETDLAARVLREEHHLYVEVAAALCEERIIWREDGVPLIKSRENPDELY
ncbi:Phosphoribosylglycinamide formyltransferase, chloroplastic [Quillaja saponaria]|uniref:phosphoribosylglycinamide formyltransferase 1 n=1 Tax=Quillaja saponaria TaxID=32244 RepID=A0AAD7KV30_QUISA|nr:Phosphoribosylglycinamide formyltransferase, chloroplastic [Quillaja saponaria]